jgi:hypothetical protein
MPALGTVSRPLARLLIGVVGVVVPDLAMALTFLVTWLWPTALGESMVGYLVMTVVLEFPVIHSAAFMGEAAMGTARPAVRALRIIGLGGLYMGVLWPIGHLSGEMWIVWAFWALVLNRAWTTFAPAAVGHADVQARQHWALSIALYMAAVVITAIVPVPALGLSTPGVWTPSPNSGGLWNDAPQHALAFGVLYFGVGACIRATWFRRGAVP